MILTNNIPSPLRTPFKNRRNKSLTASTSGPKIDIDAESEIKRPGGSAFRDLAAAGPRSDRPISLKPGFCHRKVKVVGCRTNGQ